jgi:hypothetical protein
MQLTKATLGTCQNTLSYYEGTSTLNKNSRVHQKRHKVPPILQMINFLFQMLRSWLCQVSVPVMPEITN